jgi:hypothetical protein
MQKLLALAITLLLATPAYAGGPVASLPPGLPVWTSYTRGRIAPTLKANDVIAFVGDSVTQLGSGTGGWLTQFYANITAQHPELGQLTIYNCGVGGDTVPGVFARLGPIFALKPTVFVLWIGIHEVNETSSVGSVPNQYFPRGPHGTLSTITYGYGIDAIINACKTQPNIREIVIVNPMCSGEKHEYQNAYDDLIDVMSQTCKDIAWSDQVACIDIRTQWILCEAQYNTKDVSYGILTNDGTHVQPNTWGASEVATFFQKDFGL